jgi:CubicO group peptidase (beta-lactamase class C family)
LSFPINKRHRPGKGRTKAHRQSFRIGSITKQYTAISILQLVEQGKISLQDSIQKFIPDFPHKGHTITIENLLTHTSGIVDYEVLNFPIPTAIRVDFPPKLIIDSLGKLPLGFVPGTKFQYSNSNYFLLAYIIEQVSGHSYQEYLIDHLFNPAGLHNTYYDSPDAIIPNRINGYSTQMVIHFKGQIQVAKKVK